MRNVIGVDISAKTFDAAVKIKDTEKTVKFHNTEKGFIRFKKWIDNINLEDVYICMESTGVYFEELADYIGQYYKVCVINPLKIKKYADSRFMRTKTDKQDAKLIAQYGRSAEDVDLPIRKILSDYQIRLKRLMSLCDQLVRQQTAEKNRLDVAKDEFVKNMHESNIIFLNHQINKVQQEISDVIKNEESGIKKLYDRLQTIPSIGKGAASKLAYYLDSIDFKTVNQFVAYAGLNPHQKQSGTSVKGSSAITKFGNRKLRSALFMPAMLAYARGYFPDLKQRLLSKKKKPKVIIVAIMRKLAVIAYYLHKNQEDFNQERYNKI